jgi:hypothetical protein
MQDQQCEKRLLLARRELSWTAAFQDFEGAEDPKLERSGRGHTV